jgi:hypothetical protein
MDTTTIETLRRAIETDTAYIRRYNPHHTRQLWLLLAECASLNDAHDWRAARPGLKEDVRRVLERDTQKGEYML